VGQWAKFYVTLNRRGFIVFSRKTYERLGSPSAFELLFDPTNNRIGLKPSVKGVRNAYTVCPNGKHGGKLVRAWRLLYEFNIDVTETLEFQGVDVDQEGTLVLDLRTAKVSNRSLAHKKNSSGEMKKTNLTGGLFT
jgi:hypothetical protein